MKLRPVLMAVFAAATLGGCATYDYVGSTAPGGYYHGRPSTEYIGPYTGRYGYPGVGYGTGYGYLSYGYGYPSHYRYGYGNPYGHGYYRPPYRPPVIVVPPTNPPPTTPPSGSTQRPPPWRNPTGQGQVRDPERSAYWQQRREQAEGNRAEGNRGPSPWRNPGGQVRDPERSRPYAGNPPPRGYAVPRPSGEGARPTPSVSPRPQAVPRPQAAPRPQAEPRPIQRNPESRSRRVESDHRVVEP